MIFGQDAKIQIQIPDTARDFGLSSEIFRYDLTTDNRTIYYTSFDKRNTYVSMNFVKQLLPKRFVIEGLTDGSGVNCNQTEFQNVKPAQCEGQIQLRSLTKDDWVSINENIRSVDPIQNLSKMAQISRKRRCVDTIIWTAIPNKPQEEKWKILPWEAYES